MHELILLAVGRIKDASIIGVFPDYSDSAKGSVGVFRRLLRAAKTRFVAGQRQRLQWGDCCISFLVDNYRTCMYFVVAESAEYPERVIFLLLQELANRTQEFACFEASETRSLIRPQKCIDVNEGFSDCSESTRSSYRTSYPSNIPTSLDSVCNPWNSSNFLGQRNPTSNGHLFHPPQEYFSTPMDGVFQPNKNNSELQEPLLSELYDSYSDNTSKALDDLIPGSLSKSFNGHFSELMHRYQNPCQFDNLCNALQQVNSVRSVVNDSLQRVIAFSGSIDALEEKSASLSKHSFDFDIGSSEYRKSRRLWYRALRYVQRQLEATSWKCLFICFSIVAIVIWKLSGTPKQSDTITSNNPRTPIINPVNTYTLGNSKTGSSPLFAFERKFQQELDDRAMKDDTFNADVAASQRINCSRNCHCYSYGGDSNRTKCTCDVECNPV